VLYQYPSCGEKYRLPIEKLKEYLARMEKDGKMREREIAELALSLTFIGGMASLDDPNREWFVAKVNDMVWTLGLKTWDDVKGVLMKFLWIEGLHQETCSSLWEEAVGERHVTRGYPTIGW
jgi:hypothetical protein